MSRGRGLLPQGAPRGGGLASWTGSAPALPEPPRCRGPGLSPSECPQKQTATQTCHVTVGCDSVGPLRGRGPAGLRGPRALCMSLYFNPRSSSLGHGHPPSGRDVPGDSCWPWSGRSPALIVPLKQAGQSPVSSQPAAWVLPGQGQGPECQLAVPERRLRFPASGRERALPKRAGSGSPCPRHGPVCTRRRPRLLSSRRGVSDCRPGAPASAGRVAVDTVVGTGDVGSLVSPRVRAGTSAGSALLTGQGGRRNPRAGLRAPPPPLSYPGFYFKLQTPRPRGPYLVLCCPGLV